ncbi:MAG: hypothetical protein QOH01_2906 [Verrucomicrobiota bacterium]|jgi:5S rRNA maturation endonuclease (ribonuclease M5)
MTTEHDYDVAFSFAGEDRQIVERIATRLKQQNVSVFYDRDKQADMWGKNLQEYLTDIYLKRARFCIMFISQAYAEKMWTRQERRSAMARAMQQKQEYILPIRLDQTELEGLLPSVHYINLADSSEDEIVSFILEKLDRGTADVESQTQPARAFKIAMPKVKKTFTQREKDVFAREAFETITAYFQQALKQLEAHDADVQTEFDPVHRSKFLCHVYVKGEPLNRCKIWLGGWTHQASDDHICYYESRNINRDQDNSTTDMLSVTTDGHILGLEGLQTSIRYAGGWNRSDEERLLSPERAAELLWERFIQKLRSE